VILEGLITTVSAEGRPNVAPMGAVVDESRDYGWKRIVLRPFRTSMTYANLKRTGEAVFHVTDDVLLLAQAALGRVDPVPPFLPAQAVSGWVLAEACRWYALRAARIDDREPRAEMEMEVVDQGRFRDFLGLNRAKHAVVEAAILATRIHVLPLAEICSELARLAILVEKTGGAQERAAFALLEDHVRRAGERTP